MFFYVTVLYVSCIHAGRSEGLEKGNNEAQKC